MADRRTQSDLGILRDEMDASEFDEIAAKVRKEHANPRRAYRYAVVGAGGSGVVAIGDSPFVLDWTYLGRSYTWNITGPGLKPTGYIEGKYVDRGRIIDGTYEADA